MNKLIPKLYPDYKGRICHCQHVNLLIKNLHKINKEAAKTRDRKIKDRMIKLKRKGLMLL